MRVYATKIYYLSEAKFKLSKTGKYVYKMNDDTYAVLLDNDTVKIFCDGEPVIADERFKLGDSVALNYFENINENKPKSEPSIDYAKLKRESYRLIGKED